MASLSGTSSGSIRIQSSGSDEDPQTLIMNQRKQRRMLSNRESARRSRQRKQKHLDELTAQVEQLKNENRQILHALNATTRGFFSIEAENSVLRTQHLELSNRLHSLNEIALLLNGNGGEGEGFVGGEGEYCEGVLKPWSMVMMVPSESMAMYQYC